MRKLACLVLAIATVGAVRAESCVPGAFGSDDGDIVVLAPIASVPAPGLRYLFRDGRRGSTLDTEPPVRCKGNTVQARAQDGRWMSWSRMDLTQTDTTFSSVATRLAGRLIEPASKDARLPLVVMVHGSERTPALASSYAYMLAAQGVRVFVYDKRGTGASEGEYTQNFELLAEDAVHALAHARTLTAGRYGRAGYFGGSQGGWVAPLAATRAPVDFIAIGFGLVVSPIDEDREQMIAEARAAGLGPEAFEGIDRLSRATAGLLRSHFETGYEALDAIRRDSATRVWTERIVGEHSGAMLRTSDAELRRVGRARFDNVELMWDYDAAAVLERLNVPLLWVLAGEDREAPIERTREVLSSLAARGKPIETWLFPHTDHGMFEFVTQPDGTRQVTRITDGYLRLLGDWVRGKSSGKYGNGFRLPAPDLGALLPTQIVQAHAKAWSAGDSRALMATLDDDVRSYDRSREPNKLGGARSRTIGSKRQFETYFKNTYAKQPPSRETITTTAALGHLVVAAGVSEQPPDFAERMRFLTAYRVQRDRIVDLWHIAWLPTTAPADAVSADVIRRLNAARMAGDEEKFLALFDRGVQHFCPAADLRTLADRPCAQSDHPATSGATLERTHVIAQFAVGDLIVEQSRIKAISGKPAEATDRILIYRVRDGRIAVTWLLGEAASAPVPMGAALSTQADGAIAAANEAEEFVLRYFQALQSGDVNGLASMAAPGFILHRLPTEAHVLEGQSSAPMRTREDLLGYFRQIVDESMAQREVLAMASVGELVIARIATRSASGARRDEFKAYRVNGGLIEGEWHIAHELNAAKDSGSDALNTVQKLVEAHNRGDADGFVALYHVDARHSHVRRDRTRLGGGATKPVPDLEQRRRFYRELYAKAAPTPVEIIASVALEEWAATRERYFEPDGSRRDHLTIYRVRNGLIAEDWHLAP
jgi:uncharacterized protein